MDLVDVHSHLTHEQFKDDFPQVIERAKKAGIKSILLSGINPPTNREILNLAKQYDILKASPGIYPIDALGLGPDESGLKAHEGPIDIDNEFEFFNQNKDDIIAIGEVGLDYKFAEEQKEKQKSNFQKIINLTEKIGKPIVIHSRNAEADCIDMLESSSIKHVILHSFSGNKKLIKKAADLGYNFSVPTSIARAQHFQMLVEMTSLRQILTETDAPWLSPYPDKRNEPAFITESIKKMSEIKQLTGEETANTIFTNYQRIFL